MLSTSFSGSMPHRLATGSQIQYFYNVQDSVYNQVWFGPGSLTVGQNAIKPFPVSSGSPAKVLP